LYRVKPRPKEKTLFSSPSVFAQSESLPLYEASYTPLEAGNNNIGSLTICVLNKNKENLINNTQNDEDSILSADENEARFVAEKIRDLLNEKTNEGEKKYKPNDIAILLRTRSPQYLYEKHLRLLDIPFTSEDTNDLFYGGLVNDIMSVLRLVSYPLDNAAYAEMLRSPFVGLSLSGTAACLSVYSEAENPQPFDDQALEHLDKNDRRIFEHGKRIYSVICKKAKSESISSLVNELWYNEGYRYEIEWNPQTSVYRQLFDYLFHLAVNADETNEGLASFTDSMCSFRDSGGKLSEIEIPMERHGAINLMTIHKSKGLEFPVVFLCGCGRKSQSDISKDVYFSDETGIALNPPVPEECRKITGKRNNFFWQKANEETKRKRTAELRRLLYVGMTRAEKTLYITGSLDISYPDISYLDLKNETKTDDFTILLKNHMESKCADNENYIEGDSIINDDTFFGLLLPATVPHITSGFFNLEEIPVYTEEYIKKQELRTTGFSNDKNGLNKFINKTTPFYEKAKIIKTPVIRYNRITPVSLESKPLPGINFTINKEYSGENARDIFDKVDLMVNRFLQNENNNEEKINSASFGTIAHICVEALLNGSEPVIPAVISGFLTPLETDILLKAGKELAELFIDSPLGKLAQNSKLRENEFSFRTLVKNKAGDEVFINGTIDLLFQNNGTINVVDFKTDNIEKPEDHLTQMACYYQAVCALFAKMEYRIWLYYLRTGHAVEVTDEIANFNLEESVFE
jgi:ATP-dependent helicase/nuclease subunit A